MNPRTQISSSTEDASPQLEPNTDEFLNSLGFGSDTIQELDDMDFEDGANKGIMLSSQPDDLSLPGSNGYQIPKRFGLEDLQTVISPEKVKPSEEMVHPEIPEVVAEIEDESEPFVDSTLAQDIGVPEQILPEIETEEEIEMPGNVVDEILDSSVSFAISPTAKVEVPVSNSDSEISAEQDPAPVEARAEKDEEEDLSLALHCPSCEGELTLMPEHLGIQGNCVWCEVPIIAAKPSADGSVSVFAVQSSEGGSPKVSAPEEIEEPIEPQAAELPVTEPQAVEPQVVGPPVSEPQVPESAVPQSGESVITEPALQAAVEAPPVDETSTAESLSSVNAPGASQGWAPVYAALPQDASGQSVLAQSLIPSAISSADLQEEEEVLPMSMEQPFVPDVETTLPNSAIPATETEEIKPVVATPAVQELPEVPVTRAPAQPVPEAAPVATPEPAQESIFYADPAEAPPSPEPQAVTAVAPEQAPLAEPAPASDPAPAPKQDVAPEIEPATFAQISPFGSPLPVAEEEAPKAPFKEEPIEASPQPSPPIAAEAEVLENASHVPEEEKKEQVSPWGQPFQVMEVPAEVPRSSVPPKEVANETPAEEASTWAPASPSANAAPQQTPEEVKSDSGPSGFGASEPPPAKVEDPPPSFGESPFAKLPEVEAPLDSPAENIPIKEAPPVQFGQFPPVDEPKESAAEPSKSKLPYDPDDPDLPPEDPPKTKPKYRTSSVTSSGFSPDNPPPSDSGDASPPPLGGNAPAQTPPAKAAASKVVIKKTTTKKKPENNGKSMKALLIIMGLVTGICVASFLLPVEKYIGKARAYLDEKLNLSPADPVVSPVTPFSLPGTSGKTPAPASFSPLPAPSQPIPPTSS